MLFEVSSAKIHALPFTPNFDFWKSAIFTLLYWCSDYPTKLTPVLTSMLESDSGLAD